VNKGFSSQATSDTRAATVEPSTDPPTVPQLVKGTVYSHSTVSRLLMSGWALAVLIGLGILLLPEGRKKALVARDGWTVQGTFVQNIRPAASDVSRSILENPQSVFWRSWTPETGSMPGWVVSAPFRTSRIVAVPFTGYPAQSGIELYLECLQNKNRINIAYGNAHETWVERTIWLPSSWCGSKSRLVARSTGPRTDWYVAVGTPFTSSRLSWLKESVFVVVFIHMLGCLVLLAPGFAAAWLVGIRNVESALLIAIPVTLLMGYVAFFLFYYGGVILHFSVLLIVLSSTLIVLLKWRSLFTYWNRNFSATPFRLFFGLSLSYVLLLYSADLGVGSFAATYRFAPAVWSTDNQLPQVVAEALYRHDPIKSLLGNEWRVSDRPPLMSGLFLLGRPVWEPLIAVSDNARLLFYFYQVTGIVASTLWVVPIYLLLKSVRVSSREASLVVIALATTSVVLFNSTYVWPKMLSGALALAAYLAHRLVESNQQYDPLAGDIVTGLLFALAFLAHSGVIFGLVPLFVALAVQRRSNRIWGLVVPVAVVAVVVIPWLLWQRFEDPPGNALTKFALAGTFGFGEETKGLTTTIREAYSQLGFGGWLRLRWQAVLTLLGAFRPPLISWLWLSPMDFLGQLRLSDFAFVFPSMGVGNLGWLVLAAALIRARRDATSTCIFKSPCASWVLIAAGGIALNIVLTWHLHVVHHQSYVSLLLMLAGLYSALLLKSQSLRRMVLAGQFAYFALVWFYSPLAMLPWRYDHMTGWLLSLLGLWLVLPPKRATRQA
jgi:hypothetical protein